MSGGDATDIRQQVGELDRKRRMRNTRALGIEFSTLTGVIAVPMWLAGIDARVAVVTFTAAFGFGAIAWATRTRWGGGAAVLLNVFLAVVLLAGVAVNGQIGPGPAFVGFSLFVAVATLPLRGVIAAGIAGALNVAAMTFVARGVPQTVETPVIALTYGLALCCVTTLLGVVATANAYGAVEKVVERERRAVAAEARASESEALYRLITDSMSDLVALLDDGGRFLYASPSFERVLGVSPEALLRTECFDRIQPDDRRAARSAFDEALAEGTARGSFRCGTKDGGERWVEWLFDAASGRGAKAVAVAARDVTEQRALRVQLEQAQKMDALGRMAAAVAHDFNNLLTVISAAVSMSRRDLPEGSPGWELLGDAAQATSGAAALTGRLLAFSRKAPVATEVVDSRKALGGLTELLPRALGPSVALKVDLGGDLPPVVAAPAQLEQVVLNLAINARDAMPRGGTMSIVARARDLGEGEESECKPGTWLELAVSDTGTGMTKDVMAHIFEPFFTTKPAGKGTGLGLSTCYGIIRQLGGNIRVTSEVGTGTTFRVLLPRAAG